MSVLVFPDSPVDGQLYPPTPIPGVNQYRWNASANTWEIVTFEGDFIEKSIVDAKGDLIVGQGSDDPQRLPVGNDGDILVADSAEDLGVKWEAHVSSIPESIIDNKGDIIVGEIADTPAILPVGNDGDILVADSAEDLGVKWEAPVANIPESIIEAKGDLIVGELADTPVILPVGSDGDVLVADSSEDAGVKWGPLAAVATSGDYADLSGTPVLATVATSGSYNDLSGTPVLATVATSGSYTDLSGTPSIPSLSSSNPQPLGTASAGAGTSASRADHVHAMPTASDVGALPITFTASSITYAATIDLNMASLAGGYRTINLAGDLSLTTSNRASGRTVVIRIICDSTLRTLTFPSGWVFIGSKPSDIAASKTAILSLTFFGTGDTDCVAAYGVQS